MPKQTKKEALVKPIAEQTAQALVTALSVRPNAAADTLMRQQLEQILHRRISSAK